MVAKTETQILYKRRTAEILNGRNGGTREKDLCTTDVCNNETIMTQKNLFNTNNSNNNSNNNNHNDSNKNNEKNSFFGNHNNNRNKKEVKNNDHQSSGIVEENTLDITLPMQIGTDHTFKRKIVWFNAIGFLILHILGVIGVITILGGYAKLTTSVYGFLLTLGSAMGVTMGAHRLFTHRSFKAKTWLRVTLIIMHTLAGQNCLYVWVRDHRQHHKYSDTDADPHNATRGFFFSHIGWLMSKKHPKVIEYGKKIDMSDLEADPWVMLQKKHYKKLYFIFTLFLPTIVPVILWGEDPIISLFATFFARNLIQLNFTWSVNSVAHIFGSRPYDKRMLPVESKLVSILAVGEGWHNYHHTFPWDYRTSELGMPYNLTTYIIDWLASKGHIYERKFVSENMLKSRVLRTGDGTHPKYGHNNANMMPQEISESELLKSQDETLSDNNVSEKQQQNDPLRKYIVDRNQLNPSMLDKLESCSKIDGINNNEITDLNDNKIDKSIKNEKFINNKQMLNVST